jgi:hypothetical protein
MILFLMSQLWDAKVSVKKIVRSKSNQEKLELDWMRGFIIQICKREEIHDLFIGQVLV